MSGRAEQPVVVFDHVGKTYDDGTVALQDVSFTVNRGDFVFLVGPTGCGKSTAIRMLGFLSGDRSLVVMAADGAVSTWGLVRRSGVPASTLRTTWLSRSAM